MDPINSYTIPFDQSKSASDLMGDPTKYEGEYLYGLLDGKKVKVALDSLNNYPYKLLSFIPLTLQYQNRYYIFIQEDLNLWGESRTLNEARENILSEIIDLYKRLSSLTPGKLGPYPQSLLKILKNYIDE